MTKELELISKEFGKDLIIEEVDAQKDPRSNVWGVMSVPMLFLLKGEKHLECWRGFTSAQTIIPAIHTYMESR